MNTAHGALLGYGLPAYKGYAAKTAAKGETTWVRTVTNVALFFAAPFIGLAYLIAFPVIGLALLIWIGCKAAVKNDKVRPVALTLAAPFIALAFLTVGPFVGIGALAWAGGKALAG
jgi:hypothetical protein